MSHVLHAHHKTRDNKVRKISSGQQFFPFASLTVKSTRHTIISRNKRRNDIRERKNSFKFHCLCNMLCVYATISLRRVNHLKVVFFSIYYTFKFPFIFSFFMFCIFGFSKFSWNQNLPAQSSSWMNLLKNLLNVLIVQTRYVIINQKFRSSNVW